MTVTFRLAKDNREELSVNLSNRNAHDLLVVLDRPNQETHAGYGCWNQEAIEQVLAALSDESRRKEFELAEKRDGNFISFGRDVDYCQLRFEHMRKLCKKALERNLEIVFS